MSFNEKEPQESRDLPRRRFAMLAVAAVWIVLLVLLILLIMRPIGEDRCRYPASIDLEAAGNSDGWFNQTVAKTCTQQEDDSDTLSLSNIGFFVFWENKTVYYLEKGVEVTWITLSNARENGLNSSYEGSVIFFDTDGDGLVSEGDSLMVKSFASGGPLREGGGIWLETDGGHLSVGGYECCE